jgi:hypothetical protein
MSAQYRDERIRSEEEPVEEHMAVASRAAQSQRMSSPIVELRQYTLLPGKREILIALFEREFIEEQEVLGMEIIDHFRDLDDPDRFVWLRGFPDMPTRAKANEAFYGGPVWAKHRDAANATLLDSDNVLLLRPAFPSSGYPTEGDRPPVGAAAASACLVVATICPLDPVMEDDFPDFFVRAVAPALTEAGATILAAYATEHSPNNYPRLPIREGEHVFVWFARFADVAAYEEHRAALARSRRWRDDIAGALAQRLDGVPEVRRLLPTARSRMRS